MPQILKCFFYLLFSFRTREISQILICAKWGESLGNWLKANHLFSFLFWPFGDTLGWSYTINIGKEDQTGINQKRPTPPRPNYSKLINERDLNDCNIYYRFFESK